MTLENKLKEKVVKDQTTINKEQFASKLSLNSVRGMSNFLSKFLNKTLPINERNQNNLGKNLEKYSKFYAGILLGQSKLSLKSPWFRIGFIDQYLRNKLSIEETDPVLVVSGSLLRLFKEVFDLSQRTARSSNADSEMKKGVDDILQRYAKIFLGIPVT